MSPTDSRSPEDRYYELMRVYQETLTELVGSSTDSLAGLTSVREALSVARDKIDRLEGQSDRMEERTRALDSTHYTDVREMRKLIQGSLTTLDNILGTLAQVNTRLLDIATVRDLKDALREALSERALACPATQETLRQTLVTVMREVGGNRDRTLIDHVRDILSELLPDGSRATLRLLTSKWLWMGLALAFAALLSAVLYLSGASSVAMGPSGIEIKREAPRK